MKKEILSKEEIDALAEVFSKKTPKNEAITESAFRSSASPRYPRQEKDEIEHKNGFFLKPDKNFQELKKQFEKVSELFSYSLVSSLSRFLKRDVVLNNLVVEQPIACEDFLASMNNPSCMGIFTSQISKITALMELDLNLAYSIVDIMLGGKGDSYLSVARALTDLELELMKKPMEQILLNLDKVLNLKLQLEGIVTYPSQVNINSSHEVVVPLAFDIVDKESALDDEATPSRSIRTITFCIPRVALELQFKDTISIDDKKEDKYCEAIKKSPFRDMPLRIQAHFPKAEITIGELMEIKIGDTIALDMQPDADVIEVDLLVEGYPKFRGKLGAIGRYKAVEVISAN